MGLMQGRKKDKTGDYKPGHILVFILLNKHNQPVTLENFMKSWEHFSSSSNMHAHREQQLISMFIGECTPLRSDLTLTLTQLSKILSVATLVPGTHIYFCASLAMTWYPCA